MLATFTGVATTRGHDASDAVRKGLFGRQIARLRTELGMTQGALGRAVGLSGQQTVSEWERGERMPDITLWPRIAHVLGVSPHDLAAVLWGDWERDGDVVTIEDLAVQIVEIAKQQRKAARQSPDGDGGDE